MGEKCDWLCGMGYWIFLVVGWVEWGGVDVLFNGNLVLWFYVIWGIGFGVVEVFENCV